MKRNLLAFLLAVIMIVSCLVSVTFAKEADDIIYLNDYSHETIENGNYNEYPYESNGSAWHLNAAGSWAWEWLVNDSHSKDGNYMVIAPASQNILLLTKNGTSGSTGKVKMKKNFSFEFSFNSLKSRPSIPDENDRSAGKIQICMFPYSSTTSDGRSGEGVIMEIPVEKTITVVDDTTTKETNEFATERGIWYDVKVTADFMTAVPTFNAYIKKSTDADYTLLAENVSFPKSGDYSEGIGAYGIMQIMAVSGSAVAVDDMKLAYEYKKVAPTARYVFASGSGKLGESLYGLYEFNGLPVEGESKFEWLSCDTENGEYKPVEGVSARTLVLENSLKDKWVKFKVTPVNEDGEEGEPALSPAIFVCEKEGSYGVDSLNDDNGEIKVAFLGGSITYGTGATKWDKRYSTQLIKNWFETKYPNKTVTEINSGIGGTPSELGLMRLNREISSQEPDVVFVEYAVNDSYFDKATAQRQYEGIVRQLLKLPKQPVVIPLYTCQNGLDETTALYQKEVADYYGLGSVNFIEYIKNNGGDAAWKTLTADGTHPNDSGYAKYTDIAIAAFNTDYNKYFGTYSVPDKNISDHEFKNTMLVPYNEKDRIEYEGNFKIEPSDSQKDLFSGYAHWGNGAVTSNTIGDKITFKFKGSSIGLWSRRGRAYGKLSYNIDNGKFTGTIDCESIYEMAYPCFFKCDIGEGEHTIVLENIGGGTENKFTYGYFFTDDDYELKPNPENVKISGSLNYGQTLKVNYDGPEEVTYQWLYYDDGQYKKIPNAVSSGWKITSTYAGKLVRAEVTAKNGNSSQSPDIEIPGTDILVLYGQTYENSELGKHWNTNTYSSWVHNVAGSYAYVWMLNDSYSKSGNYITMFSVNDSPMLCRTNSGTDGKDGKVNFVRDFVAEYSFNSFSLRDDLNGKGGNAEVTACMWPASLPTSGRDDAAYDVGKLVSIAPGRWIKCYNDGTETLLSEEYVPAKDEWYDVKIATSFGDGSKAPTYSVYLKKSAESDYTLVAENMSYPKGYSYENGIDTDAFLYSTQKYAYIAYDDIKLYYPPLAPQAPSAENLSLEYEKMATGETVTAKYDFVDENGDEEADSLFEWFRCSTEDGKFTKIQGASEKSYVLTEADENQYIKYKVTPCAKVEPIEGTSVESRAFLGAFAPKADNIRLSEGAVVGRNVSAEFDYSDVNGDDAAKQHKYEWYVADTADGTPNRISGESGKNIEVKKEYSGKYLFVKVIPVSSERPYEGNAVMSDGFLVGGTNRAPEAANVEIKGNVVVGVAVEGTYEFSDPDGDTQGKSEYAWLISDDNVDFTVIENQTDKTLYLNEAYKDKYIKFRVTPRDSGNMTGTPVLSEAVLVAGKLSNELYVSIDGDDKGDGTLEAPFKTLEGARDAIRKMKEEGSLPSGGITVYIRGGEYSFSESFKLSNEDSGTEDAPIVYRNYKDEKVTLSGKHDIDFSKFTAVTDENMKNKLRSEEARTKVKCADLSAIGLEDFEPIKTTGQSQTNEPLIFFNGVRCTISQYPNSETLSEWPLCVFSSKDSAYTGTQEGATKENGIANNIGFVVKYSDEILSSWSHNSDQWLLMGYLKYYWAPEIIPVAIDASNHFIKAKRGTVYGVENGTVGRPFKIINVYEELDKPGEWYIDTVSKKMYIYPVSDTADEFYMSTLKASLISMENAENVTVRGISLTGGCESGVSMKNCKNTVVDSCEISGFNYKGVSVKGGYDCGIKNSHLYNLGCGGIELDDNGDVKNRVKSNNFVTNNKIHDFQLISTNYTAAVYINNGVGNLVNHNEFYNCEHTAIRYEGPLNVIEYNEFHDVVKSATDMAAVYAGRHLYSIGNVIRYNYFHDIGGNSSDHGTQSIFFDDGMSGNEVYCNVFGNHAGSAAAVKNYGGFDTEYYNNLFLNNPVIGYEGRWEGGYWASYARNTMQSETILKAEKYYEDFPWLKRVADGSFTADEYDSVGNTLKNNLFFGIDTQLANPYTIKLSGMQGFYEKGNLKYNANTEENKAYFEDYENGDFTLTQEAYAKIRKKIPEFMEIPFREMGLMKKENAAPAISNVMLNGNSVLSITYDYSDNERDLESGTVIKWYVSDSKDGDYTEISGESKNVYTVSEEYFGKYIKVGITPKDSSGSTGETVYTDSKFIVGGEASLKALADTIDAILKNAESGMGLGQYPEKAISDMKTALDEAKAVLDGSDSETGIEQAAKDLDEAYENFKDAQITTLKNESSTGEINIPSDLRRLELILGNVTGKITVTGCTKLPQTVVSATVNGVDIKLEIPAGTEVEDLIEPLSATGADIVGNHYLSVVIGTKGKALNANVTVQGAGGKVLYGVDGGNVYDIPSQNSDGNKRFTLENGGEILITEITEASKDASLKSIFVDGKKLTSFRSNKYDYTVRFTQNVTSAVITAEANDKNAKVEISGGTVPGKVTITVTAQDKTVKPIVYTLQLAHYASNEDDENSFGGGSSFSGGTHGGMSGIIGGSGGFYSSETTSPNLENEFCFDDIRDHWAKNDIMAMYSAGFVSGVGENRFEPERNITRAEFAALIARVLRLSEDAPSKFSDVEKGSWYEAAVNACAEKGIISGYDGKFRPNDTITREEMAVVIVKAYEYGGNIADLDELSFTDSGSISQWAMEYVAKAVAEGFISGMGDSTFVPKNNATRAQAASIVRRLINK